MKWVNLKDVGEEIKYSLYPPSCLFKYINACCTCCSEWYSETKCSSRIPGTFRKHVSIGKPGLMQNSQSEQPPVSFFTFETMSKYIYGTYIQTWVCTGDARKCGDTRSLQLSLHFVQLRDLFNITHLYLPISFSETLDSVCYPEHPRDVFIVSIISILKYFQILSTYMYTWVTSAAEQSLEKLKSKNRAELGTVSK